MNEIIALSAANIGGEQIPTVNARDLHAFLGVKTEFKDWIARRIKDFSFVENTDFCSFLSESSGGRPSKEFSVSLGMAKELAMVKCERQASPPLLHRVRKDREGQGYRSGAAGLSNGAATARLFIGEASSA